MPDSLVECCLAAHSCLFSGCYDSEFLLNPSIIPPEALRPEVHKMVATLVSATTPALNPNPEFDVFA